MYLLELWFSPAETWMDLETVIQSELSQKEKNKYRILTHVCGIQKNGTDEPVCRAEVEIQMQRRNVWIPRGEKPQPGGDGGLLNQAIGIDMYTLMCIKLMTDLKKREEEETDTLNTLITRTEIEFLI